VVAIEVERLVDSNDLVALSAMLARAFQNDPPLVWAAPDPVLRRRHLPRYFEIQLRHLYLPKGSVFVTSDRAACALWAPPDRWRTSTMASLPLFPVMARACRTKVGRALRMLSLIERKHAEIDTPHYYLGFLGADPDAQGRGRGSALLDDMVQRCEIEGVGAYLESSTERNRVLYSRFGFEVVEELHWPGGGPPFWRMWRPEP
jgi:GNAT superfamily N-acetyltransferase